MAEKEKKQEEMKRRDFLFKAAEAAALALFGGMGLAEVIEVVRKQVREREAMDKLVGTTVQELAPLLSKVDYELLQSYYPVYQCIPPSAVSCNPYLIVCGSGAADRFYCGGQGQHFDCVQRDFDCQRRFVCHDFRCGVKFDCQAPADFVCDPVHLYTRV